MLNPALLDVSVHREYGGRRVRMGVELDDDGVPLFYWLRASRAGDAPSDYTTVGRHLRVPARDMAHHFISTEVDQIRGIPWLTVGARRLWLLQDFEEAAAVASSNAAKRQGFFTSPTGEAPPGMADVILSKVKDAAAAAGRELSSDEMRQIAAAAVGHVGEGAQVMAVVTGGVRVIGDRGRKTGFENVHARIMCF